MKKIAVVLLSALMLTTCIGCQSSAMNKERDMSVTTTSMIDANTDPKEKQKIIEREVQRMQTNYQAVMDDTEILMSSKLMAPVSIKEPVNLIVDRNMELVLTEIRSHGEKVSLVLTAKNKRNKTLELRGDGLQINGLMINFKLKEIFEAKAEKEVVVNLPMKELAMNQIQQIKEIAIKVRVEDFETGKPISHSPITVIKTSAFDDTKQELDGSGHLFYQDELCRIVFREEMIMDQNMRPGVLVYIENNSDHYLEFMPGDIKVNNQTNLASFSLKCFPHTRGLSCLSLDKASILSNQESQTEELQEIPILNQLDLNLSWKDYIKYDLNPWIDSDNDAISTGIEKTYLLTDDLHLVQQATGG